MRNKFTNLELYQGMIGQPSAIFFQSCQMAYDLAKKAERAYRFERGLTDSNFIKFGYWDSLRKGLLAGEQIHYDLKRLDVAYLEQSKREYEITKHISLMLHDPLALIALKETGQCEVFLPEALFDADYSGHYMRRIKSVSLTIPCVVGPYTSINCTLTLLSNKTRIKSIAGESYSEREDEDDDRFVINFAAMQSIATSHAQNDSGMFELNFRDERYLPFEGAGVISRWRIEMPKANNAFDFNTLSDVVLHFKYTAREGGEILRRAAQKELEVRIADTDNAPLARLFSAKHEFPTEWYRFWHPSDATAANQAMQLDLKSERFPFQYRGREVQVSQVEFFLKLKDENDPTSNPAKTYVEEYAAGSSLNISVTPVGGTSTSGSLDSVGAFLGGIPHTKKIDVNTSVPTSLQLEVTEENIKQIAAGLQEAVPTNTATNGTSHQRLKADAIEDLIMVCHYLVARK